MEARQDGDRRATPRRRAGRRIGDTSRATVLTILCGLAASSAVSAQDRAIKFGFDVNSVERARSLGLQVAYGSIWTSAWSRPEKFGLGGIRTQLQTAKASGVIPVVHWWYWGDDISPECVENGCIGRYDGVRKDKAEWYRMSNDLAAVIAEVMGPGSETLVVLETEFNKGAMGEYEPFDGYLVDHMRIFHAKGMKVVLGFGNWGRELWRTFDRAAAEADMLSAMVLQSSIRDQVSYLSGADMLLEAARYNQAVFQKPTIVTDFAFSSYPEPSYEHYQDTVVREIFRRMGEFRAAGVEGMVWRMLADDPQFDTANYHQVAERHWGLLRADGTPKAAFGPFKNGILDEAERSQRAAATGAVPAAGD